MPEKIIGILGGMGPEATIDLFYKIIKFTPAEKDQDHLRIIIDNNPKIPDRTTAILGKGEDPLPALQQSACNLEKAGADFIIIPCNTAHYFLPRIQESVNIPIINMIEETAREVRKRFLLIQKIGLLASMGVYKVKIYNHFFQKFEIEVIFPDKENQEKIMKVIYAVKAGDLSNKVKKDILIVSQNLIDKGAEAIIAGCTEIPLILKDGDVLVPIIDPTQVLASIAVQKAR
ncbi:MAG: amino acid racemase [Atribacterota bacterium]